MSSEPFLSETKPMMTSGDATSSRDQRKASLRLTDLPLIDAGSTASHGELKSHMSTRSSLPSLPSTPCTPVSAIHAQHMSEIVYEQLRKKEKRYRIISVGIFIISVTFLIIGLIGVIFGTETDSGNRVWKVSLGCFCLLCSVSTFLGGLAMCVKITKVMDESRQLASSEQIEKSSMHTYTHFQIAPSPMILRNLISSGRKHSPSKTVEDDMSNKTHDVSLSDGEEEIDGQNTQKREESYRPASATSTTLPDYVESDHRSSEDFQQINNVRNSTAEEIQRAGSQSSTTRPQSSIQRESIPKTDGVRVQLSDLEKKI